MSTNPTTQTEITIRTAHPDEYDAVGALTVEAYRANALSIPSYDVELRDVARRAAEAEVLVAVDPHGQILGTVTYAVPPSPFAEVAQPGEAEFRMLGVSPAARNRGAGELLVRACIDRATRAGHRRLLLCTRTTMHSAQRLYERLGFSRVPALDWSPAPDVSLHCYALDLPPGNTTRA